MKGKTIKRIIPIATQGLRVARHPKATAAGNAGIKINMASPMVIINSPNPRRSLCQPQMEIGGVRAARTRAEASLSTRADTTG
jgi:hypothetical protein